MEQTTAELCKMKRYPANEKPGQCMWSQKKPQRDSFENLKPSKLAPPARATEKWTTERRHFARIALRLDSNGNWSLVQAAVAMMDPTEAGC